MSAGEVAGIAALAGLCGVVAGAAITVLVTSRALHGTERRGQRIDVYTRWLGARLTASRTSLSFVAAFRALAAERRDSIYFALRTNEAQRARACWCDAIQQLDLAEAALIAFGTTGPAHNPRDKFSRIGPGALRRAINGDEIDVDRLAQDLHRADRAAIDFVRHAVASGKIRGDKSRFNDMLATTSKRLKAIVDHWSDVR